MPSYRGRISEEDLLRLLAYIKANPALGGGKAALP
jgi:hypothetical protein